MAPFAYPEALIVVWVGLFFATAVVVLPAVTRWSRPVLASMLQKFSAASGISEARRFLFPESDVVGKRVEEVMEKRRIERMRGFLHIVLLGCSFEGLSIVRNILMKTPRMNNVALDVAFLLLQGGALFYQWRPQALTPLVSKIGYSVVMATVVVAIAEDSVLMHPFTGEVSFVIRIFLGLTLLDTRFAATWNAVYSISACWSFALHSHSAEIGAERPDVVNFVIKESLHYVTLVFIVSIVERSATIEVRQRLGASASQNECDAVSSLLNAVCEVVVRLDTTMKLMDHSFSMASWLLHGHCGSDNRSLQGKDFASLLSAESDRARFQDFMARPPCNAEDTASTFRTSLRDALGNAVKVDLFHAPLENMEGLVVHIVGVREVQEGMPAERPQNMPNRFDRQMATSSPQPSTIPSDVMLDLICASALDPQAQPRLYATRPRSNFRDEIRSSSSNSSSSGISDNFSTPSADSVPRSSTLSFSFDSAPDIDHSAQTQLSL